MAYVITDINDFEFTIDDGFRLITIWKQNVRFGTIVGDVLPLYWHNKAQTTTEYQLDIDWNDVTAPVVASAAALQTAIEGMITSGWGGGGVPLTALGDLLTSDGATEVVLPVGTDGYILMADSGEPEGIKWEDPALVAGDDYFTILLGHGGTSPNDATPLWFGQRLSNTAEGQKFNNPGVFPVNCIIEKVVMSWRCTSGSDPADVVDFYVSIWNGANPPVLISDTVALSAALINLAGMASYWASSGTLSIAASAGNVVWMHYVGPYITNPTGVLLTVTLFCKRT